MVLLRLSPGVEDLRGVLALLPRGLVVSAGRAATSSPSLGARERERERERESVCVWMRNSAHCKTTLINESIIEPHLPESLLDTEMTRSPPPNASSPSSSSIVSFLPADSLSTAPAARRKLARSPRPPLRMRSGISLSWRQSGRKLFQLNLYSAS